jgi:hypothetical protein
MVMALIAPPAALNAPPTRLLRYRLLLVVAA